MDTNTLQELIKLLAQKAALPPAQSVWQTSFGQLVPYIIMVLAALATWLTAKSAASSKAAEVNSKLAVAETVKGNEAIAEVDKKVNGTMAQVERLARESGMKNGQSLEQSRQLDVERTVTAVKEAIKEAVPAPVAAVTVPAPIPIPGQIHKIEVVDSIKAVISPSKDS